MPLQVPGRRRPRRARDRPQRARPGYLTAPPLLQLDGVLKAFGRRVALRDVSLAVPRGACLALLGPNGAGKTTLLRLAAGLARPTAGRLLFEGRPQRAAERVRPRVGFLAHQTLLYDALTARQNLAFFARLYGVRDPRGRAAELLATFGLEPHADRAVASLSRGMQQRLAIARALVHDPPLLLLDEPYAGLDAAGARLLLAVLRAARERGATVVLATHVLDGALDPVDRLAVLVEGAIRHEGPRGDLAPAELGALYARVVDEAA